MHRGSWTLIRSQCAHVGRITVKKSLYTPLQRRTFSGTSHTQYGATLSFRLTHSSVDPSHTSRNTDFPINVIERQQSMHTLSTLVEEGKLDQARQILADILDCDPQDGDVEVFRQIKAIIAPQNSDNPPVDLVIQLGAASASRRYITFARDEILPLIDKFGTAELHSQFEQELTNAETSGKTLPKPKDVFEDASDDYIVISGQSKPVQTSAADLSLQQLPALLPEPVANDLAIFEDEEQSGINQTLADPLAHTDYTSVGLLDKLLIDGYLEQAYELLQQMTELGVIVPLHPKYGEVALSMLKSQVQLSADQIERFITWYSLIPTMDMPAYLQRVNRINLKIMDILLNADTPNIDILRRTTILLASKGHARQAIQAVRIIVPSLGPKVCQKFVQDYEDSETDFYVNAGMPISALTAPRTLFRNTVIKALVFSNRAIEAIPFVKKDGTFTIHRVTKTILQNAANASDPGMQSRLRKVLKPIGPPINGEEIEQFTLEDQFNFGDNLVVGMRYLKRAFNRNSHAPHPLTIVRFMSKYLATGRTSGLHILAEKAFRGNRMIWTQMLLAEMIFYNRLRLYDQVIETFVEHCYLVGVPKQAILARYNLCKARINADPSSPRRVIKPRGNIFTQRKLWPATAHRNSVWDALFKGAPEAEIQSLYTQFLNIVRDQQALEQDFKRNKADSSVNLGALSVQARFDGSSFTHFFRRMMHSFKEKAGRKIIRDMLELGITPQIHAFSELAGYCARHGEVDKVFEIVLRLESGESFDYQPLKGKLFTVQLPQPDFHFYLTILRGFLIKRNTPAADRIVAHMQQAFPYRRGDHQVYDDAMDDLESLKTLGRAWVYKRPHERN